MADLRNKPLSWVNAPGPEEEAAFRVVDSSTGPQSGVQGGGVSTGSRGGRILLVDDDPLILRSMLRLLQVERPRLSVVSVATAQLALDRLSEERFDVMVTDLEMPGMRGEELLERAMLLDPTLTCVVHSNQVLCLPSELRAKLRATINKPASSAEICATLDDAMGRAEHLRDSLNWI